MKIKRRDHSLPSLQMTAMPDLIFTILFFFMIVTHIRQSNPCLQYHEPTGTGLQKVKKNASVIDIFIGKQDGAGEYAVQVGSTVTTLDNLPGALREESKQTATTGDEPLRASIQADCRTPMHVINKVKMALREAHILKVNYGGTNMAAATDEQ